MQNNLVRVILFSAVSALVAVAVTYYATKYIFKQKEAQREAAENESISENKPATTTETKTPCGCGGHS